MPTIQDHAQERLANFIDYNQNTHKSSANNSIAQVLVNLGNKYLNSYIPKHADDHDKVKLREVMVNMAIRYLKNWITKKTKDYQDTDLVLRYIEKIETSQPNQLDVVSYFVSDEHGIQTEFTCAISPKETLAIVYFALTDADVFKNEKPEDLEDRRYTLYCCLLSLAKRIEANILCHTGERNLMALCMNLVYPGVDIVEEEYAYILKHATEFLENMLNDSNIIDEFITKILREFIAKENNSQEDIAQTTLVSLLSTQFDPLSSNTATLPRFVNAVARDAHRYLKSICQQQYLMRMVNLYGSTVLAAIQDKFLPKRNMSEANSKETIVFALLCAQLNPLSRNIQVFMAFVGFIAERARAYLENTCRQQGLSLDVSDQHGKTIRTYIDEAVSNLPYLEPVNIHPHAFALKELFAIFHQPDKNFPISWLNKAKEKLAQCNTLADLQKHNLIQWKKYYFLYLEVCGYLQMVFIGEDEGKFKEAILVFLQELLSYFDNFPDEASAALRSAEENYHQAERFFAEKKVDLELLANYFYMISKTNSIEEAGFIYNRLKSKRNKILLSENELKNLLKSNNPEGIIYISSDQINRILLNAMFIQGDQWSDQLREAYVLVVELFRRDLLGEGDRNLSSTVRLALVKDSYSEGLLVFLFLPHFAMQEGFELLPAWSQIGLEFLETGRLPTLAEMLRLIAIDKQEKYLYSFLGQAIIRKLMCDLSTLNDFLKTLSPMHAEAFNRFIGYDFVEELIRKDIERLGADFAKARLHNVEILSYQLRIMSDYPMLQRWLIDSFLEKEFIKSKISNGVDLGEMIMVFSSRQDREWFVCHYLGVGFIKEILSDIEQIFDCRAILKKYGRYFLENFLGTAFLQRHIQNIFQLVNCVEELQRENRKDKVRKFLIFLDCEFIKEKIENFYQLGYLLTSLSMEDQGWFLQTLDDTFLPAIVMEDNDVANFPENVQIILREHFSQRKILYVDNNDQTTSPMAYRLRHTMHGNISAAVVEEGCSSSFNVGLTL